MKGLWERGIVIPMAAPALAPPLDGTPILTAALSGSVILAEAAVFLLTDCGPTTGTVTWQSDRRAVGRTATDGLSVEVRSKSGP